MLPGKFVGRKSSPCRRCNGVWHYVNRLGGLSCEGCTPPTTPQEADSRICSVGGKWVIDGAGNFNPSGDVRSPQAAEPSASTSPSQTDNEPSTELTDPPETRPAGLLLLVNTRLEWRWSRRGVGDDIPTIAGGVYQRPLDRAYFAWLVGRFDRLRDSVEMGAGRCSVEDLAAAQASLYAIAVEAANALVLGEWAMVEEQWPRRPPIGYDPFAGAATELDAPNFDDGTWFSGDELRQSLRGRGW